MNESDQDIFDHPTRIVGAYQLDKTIGKGTYGKVRLGIHNSTGEKVAIKIIEKAHIQSPKQVARLQREIRFLKLLHHPHIVKVYEVIETNEFIYIIMECAVGGELFDYIVANKRVKEKEARSFFRMVLSAVDYCHQNSIIHRDLKPENLLLDDKKTIKIIDFGFGNNFKLNSLLDTYCGSPFYAAPEMILGKKYEGPEIDCWSLGVILFALLCGHLPFDDDNMKELYRKIAAGTYKCPDYLMPSARHLISRLITVDPKRRATLREAFMHPWVNEGYTGPPPNYVPQRPIITHPSQLSSDIVNRLLIFGHTIQDITNAFGPQEDQRKPDPIRATYFLLMEMLAREENKQREKEWNEKKAIEQQIQAKQLPKSRLVPFDSNLTIMDTYDSGPSSSKITSNQPSFYEPIEKNKHVESNVGQLGTSQMTLNGKESNGINPPYFFNPQNFKDTVSGWFINVTATSRKLPREILGDITRVLSKEGGTWQFINRTSIHCEIDIKKFLNEETETQSIVSFQIDIVNVPRTTTQTLYFKRIQGGVWVYKKVCHKFISLLQI